ncbi:MAG: FAD-binding oxidoreductase, partial [Pseudomonadota bacterium]
TANDRPGRYPPTYYAAQTHPPAPRPAPQGRRRADVCVIGGGFTGLSAALHLARRGYDVALLEAQRVGFGASGRNGGQVGSGQRRDPFELEAMLGRERARALWDLGQEAQALVKSLASEIGVPFHAGLINAEHRRGDQAAERAAIDALRERYDHPAIRFLDTDEIRALIGSPRYHSGALDEAAGHLDPLALALGLARLAEAAGARLYEGARVLRIETETGRAPRAILEGAEIEAEHLFLACNGYLGALQGDVAARVMPINNFIVATEPLPPALRESVIRGDLAVADSKFVINYFRFSEDDRLLFGGSESYGYRFPSDIARLVRRPMLEIFPQLQETRIDYAWGGTLGITMSRLPHLARYSGGRVLSASGFSGHGVSIGTFSGALAAEAIAGQAERFDVMAAAPTPRFPGGAALRWPLLVLAMAWFSLRDRL